MIEIIEMELPHAYILAKDLREGDRLECEAMGMSPKEILRKSYYKSIIKKTILVEGEVVACFGGTGAILGHVLHVWLLTSPKVEKCYLPLALAYKRQVKDMLGAYPRLENYCLGGYTKSLNLLRLAGFTVEKQKPYGPLNLPFCHFHIEA